MTDPMGRPATPADVDQICRGLPEVTFGTSWGDRPTYKVRDKGFVLRRAPRKDAIDPATGEMFDDLIVIRTATAADKQALVDDERLPFFTIDHFRNYNAVLVSQARLGEINVEELAEVLTDAWAAQAPKSLARAFFTARGIDHA